MPTVTAIVDPSYKTGTGKRGPWTMVKIETSDGKIATGFAPITIGQIVELAYNDQYKSYSFRPVPNNQSQGSTQVPALVQQDSVGEMLKTIVNRQQEISKKLDTLLEKETSKEPEGLPPGW